MSDQVSTVNSHRQQRFHQTYSSKALVLFLSFLYFSQPLYALTMQAYSFETLTKQANVIAKINIKSKSYERKQGDLITSYQAELRKTYKSATQAGIQAEQSQVLISLPGGQEGSIAQFVPGIPRLNLNETYIAFLSCHTFEESMVNSKSMTAEMPKIRCMPLGYGQGLWVKANESSTQQQIQWKSLTEKVEWQGKAPITQLPLEQTLEALFKNEFQRPLPLNEVQP